MALIDETGKSIIAQVAYKGVIELTKNGIIPEEKTEEKVKEHARIIYEAGNGIGSLPKSSGSSKPAPKQTQSGEEMSEAQSTFIGKLLGSVPHTMQEKAKQKLNEGLTKASASKLIEELLEEQKKAQDKVKEQKFGTNEPPF